MSQLRKGLAWPPTHPGHGCQAPFYFFSGYESLSDIDRMMRLRELPGIADDIASLRAAGFTVVFDMVGTEASLVSAIVGSHPAGGGIPAAGIVWNGHGKENGCLVAHDGGNVDPNNMAVHTLGVGECRLFVLACCWAGAHEAEWKRALGTDTHVFGWPQPVSIETGIDFYTPDPASENDLDDLLLRHLGVHNLVLERYPEMHDLLVLEAEHALFHGSNPLAPHPATVQMGQHVLAQWKTGLYYAATITGFDGDRFLARWDDGDTPSWVQPHQLRPAGSPRTMRLPGHLRVGAHGRAPRNGERVPASLIDFDGTRYLARFDDAATEPEWISPAQFQVDGSDGRPKTVGMQVRARWKNGRYYGAKLAEFDGSRFLAEWADGDPPSWIEPADIALE